jgi:DNA-binding transcriptional ArsR family regulator
VIPVIARIITRAAGLTHHEHTLAHIYVLPYSLRMAAALEILDVIAEPTRRRILDAVRDAECSVTDLVERIGMHQPGVSRHLKVLRDAGLVDVRRDAQRRMYRLRAEPLMEIDAWLEPYRAHMAGRLDALEHHLERTSTPIPRTPKEHR